MTKNTTIALSNAKANKKDEFYTQYVDIQKEMEAYLQNDKCIFENKTIFLPCDDYDKSNFVKYFEDNFNKLKLKKLISTCYNPNGCGKIYIKEQNSSFKDYLKGNGDFRSDEITKIRDIADFIITNPPFSLFREFMAWVSASSAKFAILGNMNAVTCKSIFPLFEKNKVWFGATIFSGDREFKVPKNYPLEASGYRIDCNGEKYIRVKGVRWFVNIKYDDKNRQLILDTMQNNLFKTPKLKFKNTYQQYDNYLAIEVSQTNAIPSDYNGIMGVPISFLDKYNPKQFKILGIDFYVKDGLLDNLICDKWQGKLDRAYLNGKRLYSRIFIKHIKENI
ncbi:adenine-specific methyltransferase EcoRI family protein [Campylobacter sp. JMF_01 NE2]|uniref:adenine-specific methyltransferase EcoRI family protein n=1 Tax=unclassified Campylobacter TaxID=2593542 RepID=UPI0022E9C433|nr:MULTISPECIES: adenine-specific methyltransferase EcoRI family protein [unclassified Campylobacter]MDA3053309.1 adenine-specific methyltransferase EcoRI family protein [Campylobacter sp. JMF_03 NE3]MDA3067671.1 adenine-specific methyltransferase EcoRI family protein [Campylobacter sp. JMF_01 NE2]